MVGATPTEKNPRSQTERAERRPDDSNPPGTPRRRGRLPTMGMRDGAFWFRPQRAEHAFTDAESPIDTSFADSLTPVLVPTPDGFESSGLARRADRPRRDPQGQGCHANAGQSWTRSTGT